jgi:hypothetical protein
VLTPVTFVSFAGDRYAIPAFRRCTTMPKDDDLAALRRAQGLLRCGRSSNEVVEELRRHYGLDFVRAVAALAAATLLLDSGFGIPEEPFVRPFAASLGASA